MQLRRIAAFLAGSDEPWPGRTTTGPTPNQPPPEALRTSCSFWSTMSDFADIGCFGSEIRHPNLDRLAAEGVRFSNFHVNPMCSPTRASLLTGLNSHAAGMGHIAQDDPGFPGYRAEIADNAATAAEVLRDAGYATHDGRASGICARTPT